MTHICSFILLCEIKAIEIQNRGLKMKKKESNYDLMSANARKRFLHFDQDAIIKKFNLHSDPEFIYLSFVNRLYRIKDVYKRQTLFTLYLPPPWLSSRVSR